MRVGVERGKEYYLHLLVLLLLGCIARTAAHSQNSGPLACKSPLQNSDLQTVGFYLDWRLPWITAQDYFKQLIHWGK